MKTIVNKSFEDMTEAEIKLLLSFETYAVDNFGRVDTIHMSSEDWKIAKRWNKTGFVKFGRVATKYLDSYIKDKTTNYTNTHWCYLSSDAWKIVHKERHNKAGKNWIKRNWITTDESGGISMSFVVIEGISYIPNEIPNFLKGNCS